MIVHVVWVSCNMLYVWTSGGGQPEHRVMQFSSFSESFAFAYVADRSEYPHGIASQFMIRESHGCIYNENTRRLPFLLSS